MHWAMLAHPQIMSKAELQKERERLEKKLTFAENSHAKQFAGFINEGNYQDSYNNVMAIYHDLAKVCDELGDPIPIRI